MSTPQRLELAREIHDGIAQDLVALGYELDLLLAATQSQEPIRKGIRSLRFQVDELITRTRREMYQLRRVESESVQEKLIKIASQVCVPLLYRLDLAEFDIPPAVGLEITAMATELMRNCALHSRGSEIELILSQVENHTYLEVRDNGKGGATLESSRLGLIGIKERTELLGGAFTYHSDSSGTRVAITL
ncbi:COG4585 Signal transduction histidine kinase [Candidatus Nanopelagicaceae bacterium]